VEGPYYPHPTKGILCGDCGEKDEAAHFNRIVMKRDGGAS